jgi:hypothetical protein
VTSRIDRDRIRAEHQLRRAETLCSGCRQHYPCDTIRLLREVEDLEGTARRLHTQVTSLGPQLAQTTARIGSLEEKIGRAKEVLR